MRTELAIYGASNAAGIAGFAAVDYNISDIMGAFYDEGNPYVSSRDDGIVLDLTTNPELSVGYKVLNAAIPGVHLGEMSDLFEEEVLAKRPNRLFLWPGLNDAGIFTALLHPGIIEMEISPDEYTEYLEGIVRRYFNNNDKAGETAADYMAIRVLEMANQARTQGIETLIGTIPPYSSTLAHQTDLAAEYLKKNGIPLVSDINRTLTQLGRSMHLPIIDAYQLVEDPSTGLVRAEYSFGATVPHFEGDILHLNSMGQIRVATALAEHLFKRPVTVLPPDPANLH